MIKIKCETDKGGAVVIGETVTASYLVAKVADLPRPDIAYTWVAMPDGTTIEFAVNRETRLVTVNQNYRDGKSGCEIFRRRLAPVRG